MNADDAANAITLDNGDGRLRVSVDAFAPIEFSGKPHLLIGAGLTPADLGDTILVNFTDASTGLATATVNSGAGHDTIHIRGTSSGVTTRITTGGEISDQVNLGTVNALAGLLLVDNMSFALGSQDGTLHITSSPAAPAFRGSLAILDPGAANSIELELPDVLLAELIVHTGADFTVTGGLQVAGRAEMHMGGNVRVAGNVVARDLAITSNGAVEIDSNVQLIESLAIEAGGEIIVDSSASITTRIAQLKSALDLRVFGSLNTNLADGDITLVAGRLLFMRSSDSITSRALSATAGTGIMLQTEVELLTAFSATGIIEVHELDRITLVAVENADGKIRVKAHGDIIALNARSLRDAPGNNVLLLSLGGSISVDSVEAGVTHGQISLSARNTVLEYKPDTGVDLRASTGLIYAQNGIGKRGVPKPQMKFSQLSEDTGPNLYVGQVKGDIELYVDVAGSVNISAGGNIFVTYLHAHEQDVRLNAPRGIIRVEYLKTDDPKFGNVHLLAGETMQIADHNFAGDIGLLSPAGKLFVVEMKRTANAGRRK
jgi:hypothetical protein